MILESSEPIPTNLNCIASFKIVQCTILTPIGATVDQANTNGSVGTQIVSEEAVTIASHTRRQVVSFKYQNDPLFKVRYHY